MNIILDKIKEYQNKWLITFDENNNTKLIIKLEKIIEGKHDEIIIEGPKIIFEDNSCKINKDQINISLSVFCSSKNYTVIPQEKIENYLNFIILPKIKKDFLSL